MDIETLNKANKMMDVIREIDDLVLNTNNKIELFAVTRTIHKED